MRGAAGGRRRVGGAAQAGPGRAGPAAPPPPAVPEHVGAGGGDLPAGEGAVLPAPARPPGPWGAAAAAQGEARGHHGLLRHPQDDLLQSEWPGCAAAEGREGRAVAVCPPHRRSTGGDVPAAEGCHPAVTAVSALPGSAASAW